jgi:hypothetical protein
MDVIIIHPFLSLFKDIETSPLIAPVPPLSSVQWRTDTKFHFSTQEELQDEEG